MRRLVNGLIIAGFILAVDWWANRRRKPKRPPYYPPWEEGQHYAETS